MEGGKNLTIFNVAVLDLLQYFWPHSGMDFLVLFDKLRLELDDLCDPSSLIFLSVGRSRGDCR